ncbi:hypothetical protein EJ03DRAFT_343808 [Teratosphaeria nubilosa]|uniref:DUF4470 domain-containing protein n=1 Tax=Teratosphaeria nubilosa TaxID=161662 RepID=A0A6G1L854_9PEZI|nr:hypothetical protein EJ03DRAFT_343808 [Teratosphaeria nubilosa]
MTGSDEQEGGICAGCQGPGHLQCKNCLLVLPFGTVQKFLWGSVPALDVLKLKVNEGLAYEKELKLLFAASGDLRNVVRIITALPAGYDKPLSITMNDRETTVVARNVILLLLCMTVSDTFEAVDCMLHLWYSATVKQAHLDILHTRVRGLLQDICDKIRSKKAGAVLGKTWHFGERTVRLVLTKEQWLSVLAHCDVPDGLSAHKAREIRCAITMAPSRRDFRERHFFAMPPQHRLSSYRFREDGNLIQFGQSTEPFDVPNSTFFQISEWPMKDAADPLDGWSLSEVLKLQGGAAKNDIYGKLHHYLANISDAGYLGMEKTAYHLGRLLQHQTENPHATLIALFLNIEEIVTVADQEQFMEKELGLALKYSPFKAITKSPYDADLLKLKSAHALVRNYDLLFKRYMERLHFKDIVEVSGLARKEPHMIVEKWPMRLKLRAGQPGAKEEFDLLLGSGQTGCERYVDEWVRK